MRERAVRVYEYVEVRQDCERGGTLRLHAYTQ